MKRSGPVIDMNAPLGFRIWGYDASHGTNMARAHSHPDVEMNFISSGWMRYVFGGRIVTVSPGRLALFWASIPHQGIDVAPKTRGVWGTFPLPLVLSWNLPWKLGERLMRGEFVMSSPDKVRDTFDGFMLDRWVGEFSRKEPETDRTLRLEIEARMRRLAGENNSGRSRERARPPEPGFESALAFLHAHYLEEIRASDIARAAGWNAKYLMRVFKRTLNMSMGEYLSRLRVSHAQWLLIATDETMLDVAYASGFQSLAPFYQAFGRITNGVTPLQYRKNSQRDSEFKSR
jgi:AraC-like DNA-binding protein